MAMDGGYIAASMGADFLEGFNRERSRLKQERGFVQQAGEMFMQLGTDEGRKFAEALINDPKAAMMRAKAFGGFEKMYNGMKQRAATSEATQAISQIVQSSGDQPLTRQQVLTDLAPAILNSGIPNGIGLVQTLLSNAQVGGNVPPQWWANRVAPEDWTPESYRSALQYGLSTGDWEKGGLDKLQPRPRKDPNELSPTAQMSAKLQAILNKNQAAGEALANGVDPDDIEFVTDAEANWVNDYRRQQDPIRPNKFMPYKKPKGKSKAAPAGAPAADIDDVSTADDWFGTGILQEIQNWMK